MNSSAEETEVCRSCEFQETLGILRDNHFFANLPLEALKVIAYLCERERFKPGDYIFQRNEDDGQAYYLLSGRAGLEFEDEGGVLQMHDVMPGTLMGCLSLMGKMPRLYSLRAEEETTVILLTREKFGRTMEQFPELTPKILQAIVESVRAWEKRVFLSHIRDCGNCRSAAGVSLL